MHQRDGLITRHPDPNDRRRSIIELTDHARALEPALLAAAREVNEVTLAGIAGDDRQLLLELLTPARSNLLDAIDVADGHAQP